MHAHVPLEHPDLTLICKRSISYHKYLCRVTGFCVTILCGMDGPGIEFLWGQNLPPTSA
jgi:hypothetical protein